MVIFDLTPDGISSANEFTMDCLVTIMMTVVFKAIHTSLTLSPEIV